jgi:hypothetical protein
MSGKSLLSTDSKRSNDRLYTRKTEVLDFPV